MTKTSLRSAAAAAAVTAAGVCLLAAPALAAASGPSTVLSVTTAGAPSALAFAGGLSADGRYATFSSNDGDLVPGDNNDAFDVFRRDLVRGVTVRVSVPVSGRTSTDTSGGQGSRAPSISADGRFVAFTSASTNLTAATASGGPHLYVRDMQLGKTVLVDVTPSGAPSNGYPQNPSISADGTRVAFTSYAPDLVSGDTNDRTDVFVRDLTAGTTRRVNVTPAGKQSTDDIYDVSISGDGRYVAFSSASPLGTGTSNGSKQIFVRDLQANTLKAVSRSAGGALGNDDSFGPTLSGDGSRITFTTQASNLTSPARTGGGALLRDLTTGKTTLLDVTPAGTASSSPAFSPVLSSNGKAAVFYSAATDLTADDTNGKVDLFERDLSTGTTTLVSLSPRGDQLPTGAQTTVPAALSADGGTVVFTGRLRTGLIEALAVS